MRVIPRKAGKKNNRVAKMKRGSCLRGLLAAVAIASAAGCGASGPAVSAPAPRPWIGITCTVRGDQAAVSLTYARAVREAGGVPVILPPLGGPELPAEYMAGLDGLVLTGGRDIPPRAYGEKPHPSVKPVPEARWQFERALILQWLKTDKPLLGICLGAQMTNVAAGGSLVQDIPTQVGRSVVHRGPGPDAGHTVTIEPDSRLREILGAETANVNSSHHQAAKRVGRGLRVVARTGDGVIEALEMPAKPGVLLVQWHPERMGPDHRKAIFGALVRACRPGRRPQGRPVLTKP